MSLREKVPGMGRLSKSERREATAARIEIAAERAEHAATRAETAAEVAAGAAGSVASGGKAGKKKAGKKSKAEKKAGKKSGKKSDAVADDVKPGKKAKKKAKKAEAKVDSEKKAHGERPARSTATTAPGRKLDESLDASRAEDERRGVTPSAVVDPAASNDHVVVVR